ncbi:MAG: Eco57I restriction-modification methylase domain-containing protein [Prevotella sp.]|nr:Eco57I restriction-modification methylase domain-containing protein [Prevotella sp.]
MNEREIKRKEMQDSLDAQKTQKDRNVLGQFSTPFPLALDMMTYMRQLMGRDDVSFIEPSIGTGVFYSAFTEVFGNRRQQVLGFEIDPHYFNPTKDFWKDSLIELRCSDFLTQKPDHLFDMLVANPPYVRHHHIENEIKVRLQNEILRKTGIRISGLAGLYCYFMMLSSVWLKEGGVSCWLVPSEFMDVNYGGAVKRYLLNHVELLHIHRFKADDLQFADALVSSCIVVYRNNKPVGDREVKFTLGGSINNPETDKLMRISQLEVDKKWTNIFTQEVQYDDQQAKLGDFFTVKRGIATGDNNFFILDKETIERYEIPQRFLRPILPSPRYIKENRIDSDHGMPIVPHQQFLFCCSSPESILKEHYPKVWEYICLGYERGVQKGYICSRRTPWYSCEEREPAAIVVPYMGRSETSNRLFRFILNTSKAITTNVYLLLYPKPQYVHCVKDENVLENIWHELNAIPTETLSRNGRFYGGGLRKMEPKELMQTPAKGIANLMIGKQEFQQLSLFNDL